MSVSDLEMARLYELGVERLGGGLSAEEAAEYEHLRARTPAYDPYELERAAAALHLAALESQELLPERLRIRLATDAAEFFQSWRDARRADDPANAITVRDWRRYAGWWGAAAASLLLTVAWYERPTAPLPAPTVMSEPAVVVSAAPAPGPRPVIAPSPAPAVVPGADDPAAERERLLGGRFVLHRSWRPGSDPSGLRVSGDVVWDARTQRGFMRFVGLRRNNPNIEQYQLWIFDARRDERYPVDGGVFDIAGSGDEQVVPIHASLKVGVPLMFAITVEKPGGVVVSDRTRIAALANTG